MKKILIPIIVLILTLGFSYKAGAQTNPGQTGDMCSSITTSNYPLCCPQFPSDPQRAVQCQNFKKALCTENPQHPICSTIRGSTQPTRSSSDPRTIGEAPAIAPGLAACSSIKFKSAVDILVWAKCIIVGAIIPLIFSLAFLFFLWGVFRFMRADDVKTKQESQKIIWWGLIGLFVMTSVWGIIKILGTTLGIDSTFVPSLQTQKK